MGRNRRWNHGTNLEDLEWEDRHPQDNYHTEPAHHEFQPPRGPRDNSEKSSNPFERRQYPRMQPWNTSHSANPGNSSPPQISPPIEQAFILKSKWLKEYLIRSLNAALSQIEQWYPEADHDEMDWQYEEEIVIDQSQEASYTWTTSPKAVRDDVLWESPCSEGIQAAGFDGGQQWTPKAVCTKGSFNKERNSCSDISSGFDVDPRAI